jgi:cytochrome c
MSIQVRCAALALAMAGVLVAGAASAQSGAELAKSKGCLGCHDLEKKKVGASFKDIAASKKSAADLTAKLKEGKTHPKVTASDAELKKLVDYILSVK